MNKLIGTIFITTLLSLGIFAQTDTDEYKKNEYYGGYSNQQVDNFDRQSFNGFEAAYVRNIRRYVGIKADFSAAYRRDNFEGSIPDPTTGVAVATFRARNSTSLYNFLGGVQIKNNASTARFKPFAHALAGVAHFRNTSSVACASGNCSTAFTAGRFTFSDTGFSAAAGGGLDIKISDRVDFRALQVDYNPIRIGGSWNNNFRIGIGFVFK